MVLQTHMKMRVTEPDFLEKTFFASKIGKMDQNGPKIGFFEFIEKLGH